MDTDSATQLLSSADFGSLTTVFQNVLTVDTRPSKARPRKARTDSSSVDETVFFKAMGESMIKKGAPPSLVKSQTRKVRPQIRKDVAYKKRLHQSKGLTMPVQKYIVKYVYSKWARKAGFADEYHGQRRSSSS